MRKNTEKCPDQKSARPMAPLIPAEKCLH